MDDQRSRLIAALLVYFIRGAVLPYYSLKLPSMTIL